MKDIRYALFDMDGTLVDSMGYWMGVLDEVLELVAPGLVLPPEVRKTVETLGPSQTAEYLKDHGFVSADTEMNDEIGLSLMRRHYEKDVSLKDGVKELLSSLKAQGVRLGLATLTPRSLVEVCLKRFDLYDFFEFFYTSDEYPEGKRAPRIFLDAANAFGTAPDEMWLFEDSFYSAKTAKSLGMRVAITEDEHQKKDFDALYAIADAYYVQGFSKRVK